LNFGQSAAFDNGYDGITKTSTRPFVCRTLKVSWRSPPERFRWWWVALAAGHRTSHCRSWRHRRAEKEVESCEHCHPDDD